MSVLRRMFSAAGLCLGEDTLAAFERSARFVAQYSARQSVGILAMLS